jgi:hypothetical protein
MIRSRFPFAMVSLLAFALLPSVLRAQAWYIAPTPEELHMTSFPEVPGAEAVILNEDELDDDDMHMKAIYRRIKILTEAGTKLGDVELQYNRRSDGQGYSIGEIVGRTIHPDGSIVPFSGKPFDKVLEKDKENAYTARVFSMPAVQVGSIIEYRYTVRWDDHIFFSPRWDIQGDLYLKKGHYLWKPTDKELSGTRRGGREAYSQRIAWAKSLPEGSDVKSTRLPTNRVVMETTVANVLPFSTEAYMPPIRSTRYHVFFYYTPYYSLQDFWDTEIKYWSSDTGHFTNVSGTVSQKAREITQGATTDEAKARKLYAFVMTLENTDYTRTRTSQEEKAQIKSAEDVLKRGHGSSDQITMAYVALARAAGLQANTLITSDRSYILLDVNWQDFNAQLTDEIAMVKWDGAEHYLDPGSRYCPFGHLEWDHTLSGAVMQDNKDVNKRFIQLPAETFKFSHTSRVGDLKIEEDGHATGTVTITFEGSPALRWRHVALRRDEGGLKDDLKKQIESWLPAGSDVEVKSIANVDNGELPLKLTASVDTHLGNSVGSRVMLPGVLFEANSHPKFPHEKRDQAVYFQYSEMMQDAVRYTLPAGWAIESAPAKEVLKLQSSAAYTLTSQQTPNSVTVRRDLLMGELYFPLKDYPELRTFYSDLEAKDHGSVVVKRSAENASLEAPASK